MKQIENATEDVRGETISTGRTQSVSRFLSTDTDVFFLSIPPTSSSTFPCSNCTARPCQDSHERAKGVGHG